MKKNTKTLLTLFGTLLFFCAFFFSDKEFSITTILNNKGNITMYLCIVISFLTSFWISFYTGKINIANKKAKEISNFKFISKNRFFLFRVFNLAIIASIIFFGLYFIIGKIILTDKFNKSILLICILLALGCSIYINYKIGFFNKQKIKKMIQDKK